MKYIFYKDDIAEAVGIAAMIHSGFYTISRVVSRRHPRSIETKYSVDYKFGKENPEPDDIIAEVELTQFMPNEQLEKPKPKLKEKEDEFDTSFVATKLEKALITTNVLTAMAFLVTLTLLFKG